MSRRKSKEPTLHIHMCPKLQKELNEAKAKIEDLQNEIWDHKRIERHFKDALFHLLSVINNRMMRTKNEAPDDE
jgi:hypothetical protein